MSIKRYEMKTKYRGHESWDELEEDKEGGYVDYEDYSALEQKLTDTAVQLANAESKCRELAAELSAVDKIHNEAVFITDDHYEQCPPEVQKMIRSLAVLQIPAYDAYLAEVRAQGVERMIEVKRQQLDGMHPDTFAIGAVRDSIRRDIYELKVFAEILRQETAQ